MFEQFLASGELATDNTWVRHASAIALTWVFLVTFAQAVRELVIIDDPTGAAIAEMTVTDRTDGWVAVLRSTKTDSKGHFHFSRQRGKTVYYLHFYHPLFNELALKLRLDKNAPQRGITAEPHIGG